MRPVDPLKLSEDKVTMPALYNFTYSAISTLTERLESLEGKMKRLKNSNRALRDKLRMREMKE